MSTRHRSTQPIAACLDRAQCYLDKGRATIDSGRPVHSLFWIMHAIFQMLRAEAKLDGYPDRACS